MAIKSLALLACPVGGAETLLQPENEISRKLPGGMRNAHQSYKYFGGGLREGVRPPIATAKPDIACGEPSGVH